MHGTMGYHSKTNLVTNCPSFQERGRAILLSSSDATARQRPPYQNSMGIDARAVPLKTRRAGLTVLTCHIPVMCSSDAWIGISHWMPKAGKSSWIFQYSHANKIVVKPQKNSTQHSKTATPQRERPSASKTDSTIWTQHAACCVLCVSDVGQTSLQLTTCTCTHTLRHQHMPLILYCPFHAVQHCSTAAQYSSALQQRSTATVS